MLSLLMVRIATMPVTLFLLPPMGQVTQWTTKATRRVRNRRRYQLKPYASINADRRFRTGKPCKQCEQLQQYKDKKRKGMPKKKHDEGCPLRKSPRTEADSLLADQPPNKKQSKPPPCCADGALHDHQDTRRYQQYGVWCVLPKREGCCREKKRSDRCSS